jgi:3-methylcrotonyl-CoA carboxylase alpha subunit
MNTRIQVEHPVTEMITGIDLVKEQIRIAMGDKLSFSQDDIQIRGHAVEARIYAENPMQDFLPSAGTIEKFLHADGQETRIDYGYREGNRVEPFYDPLIAKVIQHGTSRVDAISKLTDSLKGIHITGLNCNRDYLISLMQTKLFVQNQIHTRLVELESKSILEAHQKNRDLLAHELLLAAAAFISLQSVHTAGNSRLTPWKAIGYWRLLPEIIIHYQGIEHRVKYEAVGGRKNMLLRFDGLAYHASLEARERENYRIRINEHLLSLRASKILSEINLDFNGHMYTLRRTDLFDERYMKQSGKEGSRAADRVLAPLNGRIIKINSIEGDLVEKGQALLLIESMKMENKILAPHRSIIKELHVSEGEQVQNTQLLYTLDTNDRSSDQ